MKVLQINTTLNTTSTGRIAEEIGQTLLSHGHESYIASAKIGYGGSRSNFIRVGNSVDYMLHGVKTRLWDRHGFGSTNATKKLVERIKQINPDIIGLHNLHGYYLNVEVLFNYLKEVQKPVVWTLHDCWPFTGHCSYFDFVGCKRWKTECHDCPLSNIYPASWMGDNSKANFYQKKELFNGLENLQIITPSRWLKHLVGQSFLSTYPVDVINNGIDLNQFRKIETDRLKSSYDLDGKYILLGVASVWDRRKGLNYLLKLGERLKDQFAIVLIGVSEKLSKRLPNHVLCVPRTENIDELVAFYNVADVFINPTLVDNFPTTNLEALACGTPVVTFKTGGSPEAVDEYTGKVAKRGDIDQLHDAILEVIEKGPRFYESNCRKRAVEKYDKNDRYKEYMQMYEELLRKTTHSNANILQ